MKYETLFRRSGDDTQNDGTSFGPSAFALLAIFIFTFCVAGSLFYLRRCRRRALQQQGLLPQYHNQGHRRTLTITSTPTSARGEAIYVYDEKMNLIGNSAVSPQGVPEIRVTFPEEDYHNKCLKGDRVVVLRISDSGSVGMEPLKQDSLPPYQTADAERFQSLDLERIGGLKEKSTVQPRYS